MTLVERLHNCYSGAIHDVPFEAVQVSRVQELPGFEVRDYSVVLRGRRA